MKQILLLIFAALVMVNLAYVAESKASPSQGLDPVCMKELESATKHCEEAFMDKSHLKQLSPECMRQIEAHRYPEPETTCSKEMLAAGQAILSTALECIDKRISSRCREQLDLRSKIGQEVTNRCAESIKKISAICGVGQEANMVCYENHSAELEAACKYQ